MFVLLLLIHVCLLVSFMMNILFSHLVHKDVSFLCVYMCVCVCTCVGVVCKELVQYYIIMIFEALMC